MIIRGIAVCPAGILTALAVTTQTIAVIGPSLGGLLIGVGGWRATLAVNIPLALAGLRLGARRLPATPPARRADGRHPVSDLDLPGMGLFSVALVCLLLFLMNPGGGDWYLLVLVAAATTGFTWRELRAREPFIDVRVLGGNLPLLATYGRALLCYVVLRTFGYLGAINASAANGAFFGRHVDTAGLHHLAWFMLAVSVLFLAVTVADRSLRRVGPAETEPRRTDR